MVESQFDQPKGQKKGRKNNHFDALASDTSFELSALPLAPQLAIAPPLLPDRRSKSWRWLLVSMATCCVTGGVGTAAFLLMTTLPPAANCNKISSLSPDIDQLYCAQQAAQSGELEDLVEGLALLEQWTPDHPLHHEAQRWLEEWSEAVLAIARQKMAASDRDGAVALARQIPSSSPRYGDAQAIINEWQLLWQQGEVVVAEAQIALKSQDWERVSQQIGKLREFAHPYWRSQQATALSQQLIQEKQARQRFAEAQKFAIAGRLSVAVSQVQSIDRTTHAWAEWQPLLTVWGNGLLNYGQQQWQQGNLVEAMGVAKKAALVPSAATEAQALLQLSEARQLALTASTHWQSSPRHLFNLMEAIAAVRQIKPESRFHGQAQASLTQWEAQLQDLRKLQTAQLAASLGHTATLKVAIAEAEQITADRPRRLQAQTLTAHWLHEVERLHDRPYLVRAHWLAEPGTIPALQAAIAQAYQIPMGRSLRGEAQGLVYGWGRQIQTLEDQPLLNDAWSLATRGQYRAAIQSANRVGAGRALYPQARTAIRRWQAQLQRIEGDRNQTQRRLPRSNTVPVRPTSLDPQPESVAQPQINQESPAPRQHNKPDPAIAPRQAPRITPVEQAAPVLEPTPSPAAVESPALVNPEPLAVPSVAPPDPSISPVVEPAAAPPEPSDAIAPPASDVNPSSEPVRQTAAPSPVVRETPQPSPTVSPMGHVPTPGSTSQALAYEWHNDQQWAIVPIGW